jgi:hypothetical protein
MGMRPKLSRKITSQRILANGPKIRDEQGRMSNRMVELLGLNAKTFLD